MAVDRRAAQASPDAVPRDGVADPAADGIGHPRRVVRSVGEKAQRDRAGSPPAGPREGLERRTVANAPDQAERRFRPRARRARSTARPPLVRMRRRKPWVLARCGCSVDTYASTKSLLEAAARSPRSGTAGRRKPSSVRLGTFSRNAGRGLGKTLAAPCDTRMPVLRCAPRSATASRSDFPGGLRPDVAGTGLDPSMTMSTPVDAPVDNEEWPDRTPAGAARAWTHRPREHTRRDRRRDLGPRLRNAP